METTTSNTMTNNNAGLHWPEAIWNKIRQHIHEEVKHSRLIDKIMPVQIVEEGALTVPKNRIIHKAGKAFIDQSETIDVMELCHSFCLKQEQVMREEELMTACLLACRGTNLLCRAMEAICFLGDAAVKEGPYQFSAFADGTVYLCSGTPNRDDSLIGSLLDITDNNHPQIVRVPVKNAEGPETWGANHFDKVVEAWTRMYTGIGLNRSYQNNFYYITHADPFSDLNVTQGISTSHYERLEHQLSDWMAYSANNHTMENDTEMRRNKAGMYPYKKIFATNTVPESTGFLFSSAGCTARLIIPENSDVHLEYECREKGNYVFQLCVRFACQVLDKTSTTLIRFDQP